MTNERENNFEIKIAKYILLGLGLTIAVGVYFVLERSGTLQIFSRLQDKNLAYSLLFLIGFLASFHCVGMCGGFVVTCAAADGFSDKKHKISPHLYYNLGRIISYTFVGMILGGAGSFFGINPIFSGVLTLVAASFMIAMGLSLIKKINLLEIIKSKIPSGIAKILFSQKYSAKPKGPFVVGLLNGFMPCGPLQAVELYALGTGSFIAGALSMFFFALGTVTLMFGFGYFISSISGERVKKMMRVSGVVVILLGLFMLNRGLGNFGIGLQTFLPRQQVASVPAENSSVGEFQTVQMDLTYNGYAPNVLYIKKGVPVRWIINVKQMSGCTNEILVQQLGIKKYLQQGENVIEFTPPDGASEIQFSCGMQMVWGKFVVT